ncbi:MAG: branched-chain amino acid ABC transporter permease [Nitrospirae bacterium]|nr:branched-chain amino acid ABC transporter permease [Nitrospirota bacterium]
MTRGNLKAYLLFLTCIILFPLLFGGSSYTVSIGLFSGINALVALGLSILMGYAGQISLGQAGFYGIGAYVSAILSMQFGIPVVFSVLLATAASALAAIILAIPALRLKGHYLAVATLGFGEIINIVLNEWGPGGPSGFGDIPHFSFFGHTLDSTNGYFYLVWGIVALVMLFSFNLIDSRIGRAFRAIHDSEPASNAMGVDVSVLKIKVFVLSAVYAALAGGLYAHYISFVSPGSFSLFHSILVLMMVVVGGINSLWGAVAGSIFITVLPELLRKFEEFDVLAYGLILTLSLLFFRKGLVPLLVEKMKGWKTHAH